MKEYLLKLFRKYSYQLKFLQFIVLLVIAMILVTIPITYSLVSYFQLKTYEKHASLILAIYYILKYIGYNNK